jgi:hypothetical protein
MMGTLPVRLSLGLVVCTLTCANAWAELQSIDSAYGPGTITRDTASGLDWLDLPLTKNRSVDDITAQLGAGGEFEGFRYATTAEITALWTAAAIPDITTQGPIDRTDWTVANFAPVNTLINDLLGVTLVLFTGPLAEGFSANVAPDPSLRIVGELNVCTNPNGCVNAPPNTALASLGPNQKSPHTPVSYIGHYLVRATPDADTDGVPDDRDNCTLVANADQRDTNADGFGNICDADLNDDCIVNGVDSRIMRNRLGTHDPDADLNGDGIVNGADLATLRRSLGLPPGPSGVPNLCSTEGPSVL